MPDLFKLSVAKFMYSFASGELHDHFDNYFSDIASVHKYKTRLAFLQKNIIYRDENVSGSTFFKVCWF